MTPKWPSITVSRACGDSGSRARSPAASLFPQRRRISVVRFRGHDANTLQARIEDGGRPRRRRPSFFTTKRRRIGWAASRTRPCAQASGRCRLLHHRPQRQLHQRLRRPLQLLCVLSPGRTPRDTSSVSRRIFRKIDETIDVGGVQLLLQGGHNPDLPIEWYEDLFRAVKRAIRTSSCTRLSPPEVIHLSRMSRLPVPQVIERLIAAGLDSIPGGGAEILVDRVRKLLNCYGKASSDEWLDVMRHAHHAGLRTTATMMYGTVEMDRGTYRAHAAAARTAGRDCRLHRVYHVELSSRSIPNAAASRPTGIRLFADAGGRAAGARQLRQPPGVVGDAGRQGRAVEPCVRRQRHGQRDDRGERRPRRRRVATAWTKSRSCATSRMPVTSPSAATCTTTSSAIRCSAITRCTRHAELSTARAAGDTSVPAELVNYPARSAAGKKQRSQPPTSPVS